MRRLWIGSGVAALIVAVGFTAWATSQRGLSLCAHASAGPVQASGGTDACGPSPGQAAGNFDPAMSGVCRFSCATKLPYEAKDVAPQPGAHTGQLTQCPVSGVVFAVDADRPRVELDSGEYVLCCDVCAEKLRKHPARFLRS